MWKQLLFRILGVVAICGGLYAFYDFGKELPLLFSQFVAGSVDLFQVCTVLISFFIGALALIWVGQRMLVLRSFRVGWYYFALVPVTVWLQNLYDIGLIGTMDKLLSQSIVFLVVYFMLACLCSFVHTHWYTPESHEGIRHIALEKSDTSLLYDLRWVLAGILLIGLLILHPADIGTTIDMVLSSIVYGFNLLR